MRAKLFTIIGLLFLSLLLTSCAQNQADDIVQSIEDIQFTQEDPLHQSNMKEQNKITVRNEPITANYADEMGYYLDKFYVYLHDSRDFFYETAPSKEDVNVVKHNLQKIEQMSDEIFNLTLPPEFTGLHHVHMATLIEFESLKTTIEQMDVPTREEMTQARVFYENTVISIKQMEREYKDVLMELGLK